MKVLSHAQGAAEPATSAAVADFADLYGRYRAALFHYCLGRTGDAVVAEDIVHDVFLKAFRELPRFDRSRPFWPWLTAIAARRCIDVHRRSAYAQSRLTSLARLDRRDTGDATAGAVLQNLERARLEREVHALPTRQRVPLQLFALDGWTYAEIAEHLGCSVSAVKALIVRARARLRQSHRSPVAVALGGLRTLRTRLHDAATRGQAALSLVGGGVGGLVQGLSAGAPAVALVAVGLQVLAPAGAIESGPIAAVNARTSAATDGPDGGAAALGTHRPDARSAEGAPTSEPAFRPYQAAAERAVNETLEPLDSRPKGEPEDSRLHVLAVSPSYDEDHTMFVGGWGGGLFVTRDGGASWTRPRALGLKGVVRVLFPPTYPRDPRIFVLDRSALQVSRDGAETFETVAMGSFGDAAISPAFGAGEPSILLAAQGRLLEYRDDTGLITPLRLADETKGDRIYTVRHASDYPSDPTIIVGGSRGWPTSRAFVSRCTRSTPGLVPGALGDELRCETVVLEGSGSTFGLKAPAAGSGPIFVAGETSAFLSPDEGRTFTQAMPRTPWKLVLWDLAVTPTASGHRAWAAVAKLEGGGAPSLLASDDGGANWRPMDIPLPAFAWGAKTVAVTPTGRMVAVAMGNGLACSADGGRTWALRCPPEAANPASGPR